MMTNNIASKNDLDLVICIIVKDTKIQIVFWILVYGHKSEHKLSMKQLRGQFRFLFLLIRISNEL